MDKQFDVIGLGDPIQDLVIKLSKLPPTNVNMRMDDYCFMGGGNVATAMVACARLGLKSAVVGGVGDDILGQMILADLQYNCVHTEYVKVHPGKRSNFCLSVAEQQDGGKEFISKAGDFPPLSTADLDQSVIQSARALHVGNFTPAITQASNWIHQAGGIVSIDAAYYRPDIYENYQNIDIFIGSETYFLTMCAEEGRPHSTQEDHRRAMRSIQEKGPNTVIFTFGPDGCEGLHGDHFFKLPAFQVDAVDSTGAGDVFHGAFLYAWFQGWDVETCCRFSSGASAIKCTRMGGRSGIPTLPILNRFLADGVIEGAALDQRVLHYKYGLLNTKI